MPASLAVADFGCGQHSHLAVGGGRFGAFFNYDITILPGLGSASVFGAAQTFAVGKINTGVIPTVIATGLLDNDGKPDIVAAGAAGLGYILNGSSSPGSFSFSAVKVLSTTSF